MKSRARGRSARQAGGVWGSALAALPLAPAAQALARALGFVLGAHLVERALHGLEGAIGLAPLERLHPLGGVAGPAAALAPEALHLLEELAQLLRRDVRAEPAQQRLRLAEDHRVLRGREVRLEVGQPVHLLEELQPVVAPFEESAEVGARARERGVLEDRREVAGRGAGAAWALREVPLLEGRTLQRVPGARPRALLEQGGLERGWDRVVEAEGAVGERGRAHRRDAPERAREAPGAGARGHERGGRGDGRGAERGLRDEQEGGGDRAPEGPAQGVVLGATLPDLARDAPDEDVDRLRLRHQLPPLLTEKGFLAADRFRLGGRHHPLAERVAVPPLDLPP